MAGIYIHIPFCRSRCAYCGFYSTTLRRLRQPYVDALCREMELRKDYIKEHVRTIYLGGGTPSQLTHDQLVQLVSTLRRTFDLSELEELTVECNPDDVTPELAQLLGRGLKCRVSLGVQTFSDTRLRFLSRRHDSVQPATAVTLLRRAGVANISIDLMFGFPDETLDDWDFDILHALALAPEHISAYALTYEPQTPLHQMLQRGDVSEIDEELSRQMYYHLRSRLLAAGYEHYEISNFARPGFRSRHNSSYWQQVPYLGLGAAAHSYDGSSRQWNVSNVEEYIRLLSAPDAAVVPSSPTPPAETPLFEREILDAPSRYNDTVMLRLRTREGLPLSLLSPAERSYCLSQARPFISQGLLDSDGSRLALTPKALFVSDMVISELMQV